MIFGTINNEEQKLRSKRAQLIVDLRNLVYADAELMEDFGNNGCDYCGADDGHEEHCVFADAFGILLQDRANGIEGIKAEALEIRDALVMLLSADYHLMGTLADCAYCGSAYSHKGNCVFNDALETIIRIPRNDFI